MHLAEMNMMGEKKSTKSDFSKPAQGAENCYLSYWCEPSAEQCFSSDGTSSQLYGHQWSWQHQLSTHWVQKGTMMGQMQVEIRGEQKHWAFLLLLGKAAAEGALKEVGYTPSKRRGLCWNVEPSPVIMEQCNAMGTPAPSKSCIFTCCKITSGIRIFPFKHTSRYIVHEILNWNKKNTE